MKTSEQINEIASALSKAQAAMQPAVKDAMNPAFRSKYADLAAVWEACRRPLTSNGIAAVQDVETTDVGIAVTTRLLHTSGQWIEFGPLVVPLTKRDAHGVGSATSYGKRYGLSAAVGITSDDDDGNAATAQTRRTHDAEEMTGFVEDNPPRPPDGYVQWLDDLTAVADEGTTALQDTWKKSKTQYRSFLTATNAAGWQRLKDIAAKADSKTPVGASR